MRAWLLIIFVSGINFIRVTPSFAMCDVSKLEGPWEPFFAPRISKAALLDQLTKMPGKNARAVERLQLSGGEAWVEAVASRNRGQTSVVIEKAYYEGQSAREGAAALRMLDNLKDKGHLHGFEVVRVLSRKKELVKLDLIDGVPLSDLLHNYREHPRGKQLLARYAAYIGQTRRNLEKLGFIVEASPSDYRATAGDHRGRFIPIEGAEDIAVRQRQSNGSKKIIFGITPENIIVEATTGKMFIVDPF